MTMREYRETAAPIPQESLMADDTIIDGKIVTFYSYKGGTGRTMALANVAWILAANGRRVLAVDWDLESPGLYRFYRPFIGQGAIQDSAGVIDMITRYQLET